MIKIESAIKVLDYMFGKDNWKKYPVVEVAVRNERDAPNIFNDELLVLNTQTMESLSIAWNTDPSRYHIGTRDIAKLRPGVHPYKLSYHHIGNPAKRYVALRPKTSGDALPVWRKNKNGEYYTSTGIAINQHAGGSISTGSEGCQTARVGDYPRFIQFIGAALGVKFPLGKIRNADPALLKGVGTIQYVLVTQKQFNYILNLPENRFDSTEDLAYQLRNFVNIPKIERVVPVELPIVPQGETEALARLEREEQTYIDSNALDDVESEETALSAEETENAGLQPLDTENAAQSAENGEQGASEQPQTLQTADTIVNTGQDNAEKEKIDAAQNQPTTNIPAETKTGLLPKLMAFFGLTSISQIDWSNPTIAGILPQLAHAIWEMRYLILGGLLVWFVFKKLEGIYLKKKAIEVNTDPTKGNVALVATNQDSFFTRLRHLF